MSDAGAFLGTGWGFPPTFGTGGADVHLVSGVDDIRESLGILLSTARGERVMQEDFGCDLGEFVFGEISRELIGRVESYIGDSILHHEPRIRLNGVDVTESEREPGLLLVSIDYTIRATNSRYNMVYPFYLNEASPPGG